MVGLVGHLIYTKGGFSIANPKLSFFWGELERNQRTIKKNHVRRITCDPDMVEPGIQDQ